MPDKQGHNQLYFSRDLTSTAAQGNDMPDKRGQYLSRGLTSTAAFYPDLFPFGSVVPPSPSGKKGLKKSGK
jgi:hypothetical protein